MRAAFTRKGFVQSPRLLQRTLAIGTIVFVLGSAVVFGTIDIQQVNGDDFRSLLKQGDKLVRKGEYFEAEKVFKRAIEINPSHSGARLKLAFVHVKQRRLRDA